MKKLSRSKPLFTQVQLLEALKEFPSGITAVAFAKHTKRKVATLSTVLSRLFAYGVIDRIDMPKQRTGKQYLYRTKLPKVTAPPAADVEVSGIPQPEGVE